MMKQCWKCTKVKQAEEFYNDKTTKDGKQSSCIECRKGLTKEYESKNRQRRNEYQRRYYAQNRLRILAQRTK